MLTSRGFEVFRAPYDVNSQIAYMLEENLVNTAFANLDLMMHTNEQFVHTIDFNNKSFSWTRREVNFAV